MLTAIWEWIKWAVAALMPFKKDVPLSPAVRWACWIVLDLIFLALLFLLNYWLNFGQAVDRLPWLLRDPAVKETMRKIFLPILGQLVVFTAIALYWFYLLWFADSGDSPFPDIDEAWQEAMRTLSQAGIALPKEPLFLVVGRPQAPEEHLFDASGMKLAVKLTPASPHAPVHVFAERNAIYVTCRGASVLGKLAEALSMENLPEGAAVGAGEEENLDATMRPGSREQALLEMLRAPAGAEVTAIRKRAMRRAALGKPLGHDFMSDPQEVARHKARLAHLCRLIVRDRQPHCPANGVLLLVPLAGTDNAAEAQLTAQAAQEDLGVVRQEMKLDCPVVSLLVDMEEAPGFGELMKRQSPKDLGNRRGSGFPMATRLGREELLAEVKKSLAWVCTTYLQDSVYRIFQAETPEKADPNPLFPGNASLVLLLDEMNERADALSAIVQQAIAPGQEPLFRYAGCYMAATGAKGSQGFVAGVFQKMVREQSCVGWTQAALDEDAQCHTWATYYVILAGVLFLMGLALAFFIFFW
jgi:hypothetical protein